MRDANRTYLCVYLPCEPFSSLTWVVTLVSSRAQVFTLRRFNAASDGRVQNGEATVTRQLVKTCTHMEPWHSSKTQYHKEGKKKKGGDTDDVKEQNNSVDTRVINTAPPEDDCGTHWTASRVHSFHGDRAPGSGGGRSSACGHRSGSICVPPSAWITDTNQWHIWMLWQCPSFTSVKHESLNTIFHFVYFFVALSNTYLVNRAGDGLFVTTVRKSQSEWEFSSCHIT